MSGEPRSVHSDERIAPALSPYSQTLVGAVGPAGYSSHALSSPRAGTAIVELAWTSPAVTLILHVLRPARPSSTADRHPRIAFSDTPSGMRQEVSIRVRARESFEVLVDSHASRTQAYAITVTVS